MPTPTLRWKTYSVSLPPGSPLHALASPPKTEAAKSVPKFTASAAVAPATVSLPDLHDWPTPGEKATILLETAAEIEHALLVQYLYSAYSLKDPGEVVDLGQQAALKSWPRTLVGIAREEMGHLATVQNLLLLLDLAPNFEREDFPPSKDLYPFKLHLEPLTQKSLAKYVVAEAAVDAQGIDDIIALATESAGMSVNHVGILYGLLGLIFATQADVPVGGSGSEAWDEIVQHLAQAAYQQAPPEAWHLPDDAFHPESPTRQATPDGWEPGGSIHVRAVSTRLEARQAIREIGEQGEGPTSDDAQSHFGRFLGIYRGASEVPPFPTGGEWIPARDVPIDPQTGTDITNANTRRWAELADLRYALLLGFLEHYFFVTAPEDRQMLTGWAFSEMRSRLGFLARQLTGMPRTDAGPSVAAIPFRMPTLLHPPTSEPQLWSLHKERVEQSIAKIEEILASDPNHHDDPYLQEMCDSEKARLAYIEGRSGGQTVKTSFAADILPLFRPVDIEHMRDWIGIDLSVYSVVKDKAPTILERLAGKTMPPPPDQPWTKAQTDLFARWMDEGFPP